MHQVLNCPICNSSDFKEFVKCKDFMVSHEVFSIVECKDCHFKFTHPRPENDVLGNYYKSNEYISHSDTNKGIVSKLYHFVRNFTLKSKLKIINKRVSRGTILDYGCGTGAFLSVCKNTGWNSFGFEPDYGAATIARQKGVVVFDTLKELSDKTNDIAYDVITLWHVLEHVTELNATLKFLKSRLTKNGILIIALPNHESYDSLFYKEFWAAYDVPRHLYHFNLNTIKSLMNNHGLVLLETIPMYFDSFYVSLLSEKYKNKKNNYLNAFQIGLLSNIIAKKTKNYSSVIYVFKQ